MGHGLPGQSGISYAESVLHDLPTSLGPLCGVMVDIDCGSALGRNGVGHEELL